MSNSIPTPALSTTSSGAAGELVAEAQAIADRRRIIAEIRVFNPSAAPSFLDGFTSEALQEYLHHLSHARQKSVRMRGWLQLRSAALAEARRQLQQRRAA